MFSGMPSLHHFEKNRCSELGRIIFFRRESFTFSLEVESYRTLIARSNGGNRFYDIFAVRDISILEDPKNV